MRQSAIVCYLCVYPDVLNFASRERAPPPAYVKGAVAERELRCTKCGDRIREGAGFVYVCGEHPVEGEQELHEALCGRRKPAPDAKSAPAAMPYERSLELYFAAWNEPDAAARKALLKDAWADDATYFDPTAEIRGRQALSDHIACANRPGTLVVRTSAYDAHHGLVRFTWQRLEVDGTAGTDGIDFVEMAPDGRLRRVVGFFGPPAPVAG